MLNTSVGSVNKQLVVGHGGFPGESSSSEGSFEVVVVGGFWVVDDHDHDVDVIYPSADKGSNVATRNKGGPVTVLQEGGDSGCDAI